MSYYAFGQVNEWEQARQERAAADREGVSYTIPDPSADESESTDVQATAPSAPSSGSGAQSDQTPEAQDYSHTSTAPLIIAAGLGLAALGIWLVVK